MHKYKCHKIVEAMKIANPVVGIDSGSATLHEYSPANDNRHPSVVTVSAEFMNKHKPEAGGYFVIYEDGYQSFSPAEAFESGYLPIEDADPHTDPSTVVEDKFGGVVKQNDVPPKPTPIEMILVEMMSEHRSLDDINSLYKTLVHIRWRIKDDR